ncbi:glycosyltransferase family 2 protein [Sphingobium bisphenolivorans]|uniref:glycosyltransferase family 2 protein n=1 Tax=Sphingobium bisphenolivorans TaxID=1335760 RepID=UPI0003AB4094|nr:glycosyltransferase family A protein [Sphingobium bisphenolivorans]
MPVPTVSVIIPVFNREHFIRDAVGSIIAQTFRDLEIIVVDDGSSDDSVAAVQSLGDPRVRVVSHNSNRGIPAARNTGVEHARGEYIAWLDSDDVADPRRIEEQVRFLRANPNVALVGCCAGKLGQNAKRIKGTRVPPLAPKDIAAWLLFRSAFQQSSVTGRTAIFRQFPYRAEYPVCEDVDVFLQIAEAHEMANLPRILIYRRLHQGQTVRLQQDLILDRKMKLLAPRLTKMGMTFSEEDLRRHALLGKSKISPAEQGPGYLPWAKAWLTRMRECNRRTRYVDEESLRLASSVFWLTACRAATRKQGIHQTLVKGASSSLPLGLFSPQSLSWLKHALPLLLGASRG